MSSGHLLAHMDIAAHREVSKGPPWLREMFGAGLIQAVLIGIFIATASHADHYFLYTACSSTVRVVALACILRGLSLYHPLHRLVWILLAARFVWVAVFVPLRNAYITDMVWWALDGMFETLLCLAAAGLVVHARASVRDRSLWIDVVAICTGIAFVFYAYVGSPLLAKMGLSPLTLMTGVIVPTFDVALIALTLLLALTWRDGNVALGLFIVALGLVTFSDIAVDFAQMGIWHLQLSRTWLPLSQGFAALIGLAALHPSMRNMAAPSNQGLLPWGTPRAVLLVVSFLIALGGLQYSIDINVSLSRLLDAGVLAIMFLLIVWRAYLSGRSLAISHTRILHLATHDSATGLPNSLGLAQFYDRVLKRSSGAQALLLLRLNQFQPIGQLWGLAVRDAFVARVATKLSASTAFSGQLARVGTDQFALLTPLGDDPVRSLGPLAIAMAESVRSIAAGFEPLNRDASVVSAFNIGIASAVGDGMLDTLLREAESAMSIAHSQGENGIAYYDAHVAAIEHRRLALLAALHGAVQRREFTLHFQPVVDMATREVESFEALLRWRMQEFGDVLPGEFIPLAESIDAIQGITDWVIEAACAALAASRRNSPNTYRVAVNISARSLQKPGLTRRVTAALARHDLEPRDVCVELTESARMDDPHNELLALRQVGVALAIDDFGSGYSNLAMLAHLTADTIKLDISMVRAIESDPSMRALCASLFAHVGKHGAKVIAEGIETRAQHTLLRSLGCNFGQGSLYGRPQPWLTAPGLPTSPANTSISAFESQYAQRYDTGDKPPESRADAEQGQS
jgi:diguanylate cyclase